jgi:ribosomal protein S18 acetylase RimI-like enzyme
MSRIRPYRATDRPDVYSICVRTGASGADATGMFSTDDLLPDIFAGPYVDLEPDLAWVVDVGDRVAGYVIATADTAAFVERYRRDWLPYFAERYPFAGEASTLEERLIARGRDPLSLLPAGIEGFPAHLHIDLLPELQGQGVGRTLIRTLLDELRDRGVLGVHLGVGLDNTGARAFYARLGFRPLPSDPENPALLGIGTDARV